MLLKSLQMTGMRTVEGQVYGECLACPKHTRGKEGRAESEELLGRFALMLLDGGDRRRPQSKLGLYRKRSPMEIIYPLGEKRVDSS